MHSSGVTALQEQHQQDNEMVAELRGRLVMEANAASANRSGANATTIETERKLREELQHTQELLRQTREEVATAHQSLGIANKNVKQLSDSLQETRLSLNQTQIAMRAAE